MELIEIITYLCQGLQEDLSNYEKTSQVVEFNESYYYSFNTGNNYLEYSISVNGKKIFIETNVSKTNTITDREYLMKRLLQRIFSHGVTETIKIRQVINQTPIVVENNRQELIAQIKNHGVNYSEVNNPLVKKAKFTFDGSYGQCSWFWLERLSDDELNKLNTICKNSWIDK